jgi:hypothetical protein
MRLGCSIRAAIAAALLVLGLASAETGSAHAQTPGSWQELPNTKLIESKIVCGNTGAPAAPPGCLPRGVPHGGNNILGAAIGAWVSGDVDTRRGELVIPRGGGHADWPGNQVLAFRPPDGDKPAEWRLRRDMSMAYPPMPGGSFTSTYPDGTPASVHSYDCVAYLATVDRIWSAGGIFWSPPGNSDRATFWWNPVDATWERKADRPGGYGCASVWDPRDERLLIRLTNEFIAYAPKADRYTRLFTQPAGITSSSSSLALDPAGRKIYRIALPTKSTGIRVIDLGTLDEKEQTLATEGDVGIEALGGVGLRFHAGRLIGVGRTADGKHGALHVLDPTDCGRAGQPKCRWERHVPRDDAHPPAPVSQGVWKRFFEWGGRFYFVNHANQNVWVFTPAR